MKRTALIITLLTLLFTAKLYAQDCNCTAEFTHIKSFMEQNYAGFKDKQAQMTKAVYDKMVNQYMELTRAPHSSEQCLLIISQYLAQFKDQHVSIRGNFPAKLDTAFVAQRPTYTISDQKYKELLHSTGKEGIYYFNWDTAAYKIAVIKDETAVHDYIGVLLQSNLPGWRKGVLKLEGKMVNDSTMKGMLFMRNQLPAEQYFVFSGNTIYGDWQRVGTVRPKNSYSKYVPVDSRKLDDKTLYLKISSFGTNNGKNIDSLIKANSQNLLTMPNLVLDLRDNGGGSDYTYGPLIPWIYAGKTVEIGNDVLSTDANIEGWKKILDDKDLTEEGAAPIKNTIKNMEDMKGGWVSNNDDYEFPVIEASVNPKHIVILIDKQCASTTEQFLLFARQSPKVILMGQNTEGVLDYSNVREAPFQCMPYILRYSTTRSRRLDVGQGIDNVGIKPNITLQPGSDWIAAAVKELEK